MKNIKTEINTTGYPQKDQQEKTDRPVISAKRSALIGFSTFLILAALVCGFIYQRYNYFKQAQKEEALVLANNIRARLQESLAYSLSATKTLSFFIQKDGSVKNFDSIASQLLEASNDIDAVQLVPDGVIRYVYPLSGNEKVIGYDILKDSLRNKEALKAIQKNELFFAGPLQLRQGGMGVIGRLPIFRNNKFWGFTAVIIRMPTLLRAAGIDSSGKNGYYFQLSKINPDTKKEEFFIEHHKDILLSHSVSVNVPNGEWKLSVIPVDVYEDLGDIILLAVLGLLLSVLGGIFVFTESRRPKKLNDLIRERTRQLKESEENYKTLFEKSPLPLWIYDSETFSILEVNDAAINLYGYSREEFLEMDLLKIAAKEDIEKFLADNTNITGDLRESGLWTHLKKNKEEIQVLIFSKSIFYKNRPGRLVLLMDVSEKIKVENELIKSEEKYRSLIEQASDGIILYSFDGNIHSFNKAACTQTGYTKEEFEKLNLKDIFFENDRAKYKTADKKVKDGESATIYRELKRKDGSIFMVELNTRMLPDGKIIAIVRDITEREQTEAALKESEEKFSKSFHSNLLGFAIYDTDFKIFDLNDAYASLLEADKKDLIGKLGDDVGISSKIDPEKVKEFDDIITHLLAVEGKVHNFETEIKLKNGTKATVLFSIEKLELNNKAHWLTSAIDITVKKNAEILLQESELKYRSLIEQASDGIVITDLSGIIQEANRSMCNMSGYTTEEMIGRHLKMFIPQEDLVIKPLRFEVLLEGKSLLYERRLLKKDGTTMEVEVNSKMASTNTLIGFIRDITERKLTEEAIKVSEEKYRTLVDQASDGIFIADKEGHFLIVNPSGYKLSQYSEEELKGLTIYDLVLPEDIQKDPFHFEEMAGNKVARGERRMKRKDGTLLDVEVTAKFISGNRFLAFVRDITERKKNDYTLRYQARLLDAVSDAVTSLDINRCIVSWNHACEELYGFTTEEVMGKRVPDLITFDYPYTTNEEVFKQVFATGQWKGEFNFIHPKNKQKYHLLSSVNLLKNRDGENIGFIITGSDITDRKKAEEEIRKSNERFELIAQATNEVVWDHDFIKNETWGNKKLYELHGITNENEKINFEMFLERIHPDERAAVENNMKVAIKNAVASLSEEFRFKTASGEYRNFYDRAYIKYNEEGVPVRILGAMQDITDRELIRQQIIREKELSDSIINSLPGIFYLYNKEGKFLRWNRNLETVTGYSAEEISKIHPIDLFDEDEKALISSKIANVFVVGEDNVEANILIKNKEKIPFYFTGQAIEYEGELCLMGVGLDFSDKEKAKKAILESEAKYKELIEQASDGIFISNREGRYIDVNTSACRMLGYSKDELLKMNGTDILFYPEDVKQLYKSYDSLRSGQSYIREITLKRKNGELLDVESNSKMLLDGRFIGIVRDLTERKKAAEEIKANSELLRELYSYLQNIREEERTHIAREIHDELGQQLTGLKMDMFWINRRLKTDDTAITEKLSTTLALIDTTITTVRKIATELRPSILDDLGLAAALEWQGEEFEKRSDIKVKFASSINEIVVQPHVSTALFRIYQELLTNIARHSNATMVNAYLYIDADKLYLKVQDNGQGFEPDNIISKKTLGLRGIKERTSLIGGNYEINSTPGSGTNVLISVPLQYSIGNLK